MNLKIIFFALISSHLAFAETAVFDTRGCSKETVALALRDLVNLETTSQAGMPAQKNYDWLDSELKKIPPSPETAYANVKEKVEADAKERAEKVTEDLTTQYRALKKEIIENKVTPALMSSVNRFTTAFNNASPQIYVSGPKDEKAEAAVLRNAVGFSAHKIYTQKVSMMTGDLVKDIEAKCIPPSLPRGITIGNTKYRALYCLDPNPDLIKELNNSIGKQSDNECRTFHSCGVRTLEDNPKPNFREIVMSYACNKKNGQCPEATICLQEAAKNETQPQAIQNTGTAKVKEQGAQR